MTSFIFFARFFLLLLILDLLIIFLSSSNLSSMKSFVRLNGGGGGRKKNIFVFDVFGTVGLWTTITIVWHHKSTQFNIKIFAWFISNATKKKYPKNIRDPAFCVCRCKTAENIEDFSFGPEIQMPELSWSDSTLFLGRGKMVWLSLFAIAQCSIDWLCFK